MKGLYVIHAPYNNDMLSGLEKKVLFQIGIMNEYGLNCVDYVQNTGDRGIPHPIAAVLRRLPFSNLSPKWEFNPNFLDQNYIYMRRTPAFNSAMRRILGQIKKENPKIKIIVEIPTYPYDQEYLGLSGKIMQLKDSWNRTKLSGIIDRFAVINDGSPMQDLWGIPVIPFINGIDFNKVSPKCVKNMSGEIHLLCLSSFAFWTGYDRLLVGLERYYQNGGTKNFIVDLAGDGPELSNYKEIVANSQILPKHVVFHGWISGERLKKIYNQADIGVGPLGISRWKITVSSSLKTREYLAKGLPLMTSGYVDVLTNSNFPYHYEFPNDATPIDMEQVAEFYDRVYGNAETNETIIAEVRRFGQKKVDMRMTFKPVIDYIMNN